EGPDKPAQSRPGSVKRTRERRARSRALSAAGRRLNHLVFEWLNRVRNRLHERASLGGAPYGPRRATARTDQLLQRCGPRVAQLAGEPTVDPARPSRPLVHKRRVGLYQARARE